MATSFIELFIVTILHKYSAVQNYKEPMKATETAVDIVSKNSHRNVRSKVLSKIVACQHGIC